MRGEYDRGICRGRILKQFNFCVVFWYIFDKGGGGGYKFEQGGAGLEN